MNRAAALAAGLTLGLNPGTVLAVSTLQDADRAASTVVRSLGGLAVICPPVIRATSPEGRCVELAPGVQDARFQLSASAAVNLYGSWSVGSTPGSLSNWTLSPNGFLNLTLLPAPTHPANSLVVISVPEARPAPVSQALRPAQRGIVKAGPAKAGSVKPGTVKPSTARPAPASPGTFPTPIPASTPATALSVPVFRRALQLSSPRTNGEDVRTLQNRLIDMSTGVRGTGGDGWYGPVTEATVMDFQTANGLRPTGTVDQRTWTTLFSSNARRFEAKLAEAMVRGRR